MNTKTFDAAVTGTPTPEQLSAIARWSPKELRPEEIFCFSLKLCDNEIDRDLERFSADALEQMVPLFLGKSGLFDHDWSAKEQVARLFHTEVICEPGRFTRAGEPYRWLKGVASMLRSETRAELIREIEAGIKKEVSVGLSCQKAVCSICRSPAGGCQHKKGETYHSLVCHTILSEPADAYEWSFVAVPAQPDAGILKARQKGDVAMQALEADAALGQVFRKELQTQTAALLAACGLPADAFKSACEQMDGQALITLRDALRHKMKDCPGTPQLAPSLTNAAQTGEDFKI